MCLMWGFCCTKRMEVSASIRGRAAITHLLAFEFVVFLILIFSLMFSKKYYLESSFVHEEIHSAVPNIKN